MPLTRPLFDSVLVRQSGPLLIQVGKDGTTVDGTNPDLSPAIAGALLSLGVEVADVTNVTSEEMAGVQGLDQKQAIDVAGLYVLESILSSWVEPDQTAGTDNRFDWGKLRDSIERTAARLRAQYEKQYGLGLGSLSAGVYEMGFAETVDPSTGRPI